MAANSAVQEARARLGRVGLGLTPPATPAVDLRRELSRVEKLGLGSAWTNEGIGGKESLTWLALALGATERLVLGTGVANAWARHAAVLQAGAATLADAYPGRLVLGVGISHRFVVEPTGQTFARPLRTQREYLETMRASAGEAVAPRVPFPVIVGAIGPKMTELARDHADGANPNGLPVAHTRWVRETLGPDKLVVVGVSFVPEADRSKARAIARESPMLRMPDSPQQRGLKPLGYSEEEIAGASDRVIDDTHALGTPEEIAVRVREHLEAGADHVVLYPPFGGDLASQVDAVEEVMPGLSADGLV